MGIRMGTEGDRIMGTDYKCGCRYSMGHWFLCEHHEHMLLEVIEIIQ